MWRQANALVKRRERELNNALLLSIVKQADPEMVGRGGGKPEAIIGTIFRSETTVQATRKALGERSPEWQALQRGLIQSVWRDAADETTDVIIGRKFLTSVARDEKVLRAGLGGETYKRVLDFARAATLQQKQPGGSGKIVAVFTQGGAAVGLTAAIVHLPFAEQYGPTLKSLAGSAALLISPAIVARMLTSPVTGRLLARGLRIAPNTRAAFGLAGQLAAAAFRIQQEMKAEGIDVDQMVRAVPSELSQAVGAPFSSLPAISTSVRRLSSESDVAASPSATSSSSRRAVAIGGVTVWCLLFMLVYLRDVERPDAAPHHVHLPAVDPDRPVRDQVCHDLAELLSVHVAPADAPQQRAVLYPLGAQERPHDHLAAPGLRRGVRGVEHRRHESHHVARQLLRLDDVPRVDELRLDLLGLREDHAQLVHEVMLAAPTREHAVVGRPKGMPARVPLLVDLLGGRRERHLAARLCERGQLVLDV
jgi:hypothetical protein